VLSYRRIREDRPTAILVALVALSLVSLASGTQAGWISQGVRAGVSIAATPFWKGLSLSRDTAGYVFEFVTSYGAAREEADGLRRELARTLPEVAELRESRAEIRRLSRMLAYQRGEPRLTFAPAKVSGRFEGTLIVDRGRAQGVRESMCAITPDGVVGVVAKVGPFQSLVYTLHHADCRISAIIQRNRAFGLVKGSGSEFSHICRMEYIEGKDEVLEGDMVVTSGVMSGGPVFPSGLPIGNVIAVYGEGSLLKTAYIEPAADPYHLDEVMLVEKVQLTQEELTGQEAAHRPLVAGGAPMPDHRSLQERFAP